MSTAARGVWRASSVETFPVSGYAAANLKPDTRSRRTLTSRLVGGSAYWAASELGRNMLGTTIRSLKLFAAVSAIALAVVGCTEASQSETGAFSAETVTTSAEGTTTATATTPEPAVSPLTTPKRLTPADIMCDLVPNPNNDKSTPVVVLQGQVDCSEALSVARDYLAAIKAGEAEGQGLFLTVQGWECSWPYVEGRSHAESYLKCVDPSGTNAIRIGN